MHLSQMQNSTTSNITMSHTKQHREETFPFDGGLGIASGVGGIIPAHAGLTAYSISFAHCARDHSRVCGAHSASMAQRTTRSGSSPRMRGSPGRWWGHRTADGIIPAHAGLTHPFQADSRTVRDHPRACGAHFPSPHGKASVSGSSPRMRGSPQFINGYFSHPGIIPAHAGLTLFFWSFWSFTRDHPRACGAHQSVTQDKIRCMGSSPRMRGSQSLDSFIEYPPGIIPAHAGLTAYSIPPFSSSRDHPRACGAH